MSGRQFVGDVVNEVLHFFAVQLDAAFADSLSDFRTGILTFSGANRMPQAAPTAAPPKKAAKMLNPFIVLSF